MLHSSQTAIFSNHGGRGAPLRTTLRGYFQSRDGGGVALTPGGRDARYRLVAARHDDIAEVLAI
jgi:hypothetical protein